MCAFSRAILFSFLLWGLSEDVKVDIFTNGLVILFSVTVFL